MKRVERLAWVTVAGVLCNVMAWVSIDGGSGDNNGDAGDGGDAALDQTTPDVGNDVSPDVATDVTPDVVKDAGPDVTAIVAFQQAYAAAFCQRMSVCCYGAQLDASAPDAAIGSCEAFTTSAFGGGFENAIGDLATTSVLNSGNIVVNEPQRTNCLAALQTMSCPTISGTEYASLAQNCVGALSGTLPVGQPCGRSVECNNGYCLRDDAGVGTCVAIATVGQACNPEGNGNDECMYRSWAGSTTARCDVSARHRSWNPCKHVVRNAVVQVHRQDGKRWWLLLRMGVRLGHLQRQLHVHGGYPGLDPGGYGRLPELLRRRFGSELN